MMQSRAILMAGCLYFAGTLPCLAQAAETPGVHPPPQQKSWDFSDGPAGGGGQDQCVERCREIYSNCMKIAKTSDEAADCSMGFTVCVNTQC